MHDQDLLTERVDTDEPDECVVALLAFRRLSAGLTEAAASLLRGDHYGAAGGLTVAAVAAQELGESLARDCDITEDEVPG